MFESDLSTWRTKIFNQKRYNLNVENCQLWLIVLNDSSKILANLATRGEDKKFHFTTRNSIHMPEIASLLCKQKWPQFRIAAAER